MKRQRVAELLAEHYTAKMNGKVWCYFDENKRAYCIRGEALPSHPDLRDMYPNGWSMLDFVKPTKARKLIAA